MKSDCYRFLLALILSIALSGGSALAKHHPAAEDAGAAADRLAEARIARQKADKAFDDIAQKLWESVQHDPQYVEANGEVAAAQRDYDQLAQGSTATLQNNPAYQAELKARDAARKQVEAARATGQASDDEKAALAREVMKHNTALHKMEADAAKEIPGLAAARARVVAADSKFTQIKGQAVQRAKADSALLAARSAMEEAHHQVIDAEKAVARIPSKTRGPIAANPIPAEPITRQPIKAEPVTRQPIAAQPIARDVVAADPVARDVMAANPVAADPRAANPVAANPVAADPRAANPIAAQPRPGQPVPANPIAGNPPND